MPPWTSQDVILVIFDALGEDVGGGLGEVVGKDEEEGNCRNGVEDVDNKSEERVDEHEEGLEDELEEVVGGDKEEWGEDKEAGSITSPDSMNRAN